MNVGLGECREKITFGISEIQNTKTSRKEEYDVT